MNIGLKPSSRKVKKISITLAKITIAVGLMAWLIRSGQLDLTMLSLVLTDPFILFSSIAVWVGCNTVLGSLRWRILLRGAGYIVSLRKVMQLQLIGFFFNTAMPGAVGGDLIKVFYVIRENPAKGKSGAMVSILLDRLIGFAALFSIGFIVSLTNFDMIGQNPTLRPIIFALASVLAMLALFFAIGLYDYPNQRDPFLKLFNARIVGMPLIKSLYLALREYRHDKKGIFNCLLISLFNQLGGLLYTWGLACTLIKTTVPLSSIACIYPIASLTTALPIAPGGLGVGHVAFEKLFHMVGLSQGANIFNISSIRFLLLNMFGVIPYLFLRRSGDHLEEIAALQEPSVP